MKDWRRTPVDGVDITYEWNGWQVWAAWPKRLRKDEINTMVRVFYAAADGGPQLVQATTRLNVLSDSAVRRLVSSMRLVTGKDDTGPHTLMQHVVEDIIAWYRKGRTTTFPQPRQQETGGWLVYPVWPTGVTGVAAAPGAFKSMMAQGLALQLATGTEVLQGNTRRPRDPVKVLYLDWEADEATFAERLYALCRGAGIDLEPHLAYKLMRVPLADAVVGLQEEIQRARFGGVIIDSMSASAGGDMNESLVVNAFYDAVRLLGVPALILAHKSAENIKRRQARFFGSIMSEARLRYAINAEAHELHVMWEVFKDNNTGHKGNRLAWRVDIGTEGEKDERRLESVSLVGVNPSDVRLAANEGDTGADRMVTTLLERGPLLTNELAEAIETTPANVRSLLARHPEWFQRLPDSRISIQEGDQK